MREIISTLECCSENGLCGGCPYHIKKIDCVENHRHEKDTLALIKRLQSENKSLKDELRKECEEHEAFTKKAKEGIDYLKKCGDNFLADYEKAQKEIERLTEELEMAKRVDKTSNSTIACLSKEKAELQKQVDELKERNYWLESEHEYQCEKSYFEGVAKGQEQAVKDTAKEIWEYCVGILKEINGNLDEYDDCYEEYLHIDFIKDFIKSKGVEVE